MTLAAGTRLGIYEIQDSLGAGAMSQVWRAKDTTLGREVAVKVLPEAFTQEPDRLERFEREAQLLASLNHPNIAAIYGLEKFGDVHYLVLELIPGPTMAERLDSGPLELQDALESFFQIAQALEAAHEKGIIHRDLKPANIKFSAEGRVKLLDFGLAKDLGSDSSGLQAKPQKDTATFHGRISEGLILGTPAYMSPEQARGKSLDKRTDIWSYGCCLYETLTGRHPFEGETVSDTMAAILEKEPDWEPVRRKCPKSILALVRRCLQKDPEDRLHDIADARIEIAEALSSLSENGFEEEADSRPRSFGSHLPWALAGLMTLIVLGMAVWGNRAADPVRPPIRRFVLRLPTNTPLSLGHGDSLAISPDGMRVAFTVSGARNQLYVKAMDQLAGAPITGTDGGMSPFFSWDGQTLGFFSEGKLRTTPLMGGAPRILCDSPNPRGASWGPKGRIVFSPLTVSGLFVLSSDGGTPEPLTELDAESETRSHRWPQILPNGKWVIYTAWTGSQFHIEAVSLETKEQKTLIDDAFFARYAPTGHLVFARDKRLLAVPFDLKKMEPVGTPVSIVDEGVGTDAQSGAAFYAFASDGTLVYVPGGSESTAPEGTATLLQVDSQGMARPLTDARLGVHLPRVSPDGTKLLTTIESGDESDAWLFDRERGTMTRLTFKGHNAAAIWTRDGTRIAFSSDREGVFNLFWKPADGSISAERLLTSPHPQFATSFSPDGNTLAFSALHPESNFDIWLLPMEERKPLPFLNSPFNEAGAAFSPNGRWIAYVSDETGQDEVYIRAFPGPEGKWQISNGGGNEPVWDPNGRRLFYRNRDWMMSVGIASEEPFNASRPRALFETHYDDAGVAYPGYDITPDGQTFIMVRSEKELVATQAHVVLSWFQELLRRAPALDN